MRVLRRVWIYKPRSASQMRILRVILQRPVHIAFPKRLQPIECNLLKGSVVGVRRAGATVPDDRARSGGVRGVREKIPPEIVRSIINGEGGLLIRNPLEADGTCSSMHEGRKNVGSRGVRANNQLRSVGHQVASAAIAPKRIAKEEEGLEPFKVPGYLTTPPHRLMPCESRVADRFHRGSHSRNQT